jgi:hypothetical protein
MSTTEALAPVKKTITVEASIKTAFDTFTGQIGDWWPASTHTVFGKTMEAVVFDERVGGRVYERAKDGEEADWADVIVCEPPHRGWDRIGDEAGRADYDPGWDFVLGRYVDWLQSE